MLNAFLRTCLMIIIGTALGFLVMIFIAWRLIKLLRVVVKPTIRQLAEVVNGSMLVNSQSEKIPLLGTVKSESKMVYVLVADYFGLTKYSFACLLTRYQNHPHVSLLACNVNFPHVSDVVNNCIDLLRAIARRYPAMGLGLVLEGHSCGLAPIIARHCDVLTEIVYCNPITNHHAIHFRGRQWWRVVMACCFTWQLKVRLVIDYQRLLSDAQAIRTLGKRAHRYLVLSILQWKWLNRFFGRKLYRIKCHQTIVQAQDDPFCNRKKLTSLQNNLKCHFIFLKTNHHFDLNFNLP